MKQNNKEISKFLSYVLRHKPEAINLNLDTNGWASIDELLTKMSKEFIGVSIEDIKRVVESNDKQRFTFNDDHTKIRANQGHSIEVNLELNITTPPKILYHGTIADFIAAIKVEGLQKRKRQHVHLSAEIETATRVGTRRGTPIILEVNALDMHKAGFLFYLSKNDVWLTDFVPSQYIKFPDKFINE